MSAFAEHIQRARRDRAGVGVAAAVPPLPPPPQTVISGASMKALSPFEHRQRALLLRRLHASLSNAAAAQLLPPGAAEDNYAVRGRLLMCRKALPPLVTSPPVACPRAVPLLSTNAMLRAMGYPTANTAPPSPASSSADEEYSASASSRRSSHAPITVYGDGPVVNTAVPAPSSGLVEEPCGSVPNTAIAECKRRETRLKFGRMQFALEGRRGTQWRMDRLHDSEDTAATTAASVDEGYSWNCRGHRRRDSRLVVNLTHSSSDEFSGDDECLHTAAGPVLAALAAPPSPPADDFDFTFPVEASRVSPLLEAAATVVEGDLPPEDTASGERDGMADLDRVADLPDGEPGIKRESHCSKSSTHSHISTFSSVLAAPLSVSDMLLGAGDTAVYSHIRAVFRAGASDGIGTWRQRALAGLLDGVVGRLSDCACPPITVVQGWVMDAADVESAVSSAVGRQEGLLIAEVTVRDCCVAFVQWGAERLWSCSYACRHAGVLLLESAKAFQRNRLRSTSLDVGTYAQQVLRRCRDITLVNWDANILGLRKYLQSAQRLPVLPCSDHTNLEAARGIRRLRAASWQLVLLVDSTSFRSNPSRFLTALSVFLRTYVVPEEGGDDTTMSARLRRSALRLQLWRAQPLGEVRSPELLEGGVWDPAACTYVWSEPLFELVEQRCPLYMRAERRSSIGGRGRVMIGSHITAVVAPNHRMSQFLASAEKSRECREVISVECKGTRRHCARVVRSLLHGAAHTAACCHASLVRWHVETADDGSVEYATACAAAVLIQSRFRAWRTRRDIGVRVRCCVDCFLGYRRALSVGYDWYLRALATLQRAMTDNLLQVLQDETRNRLRDIAAEEVRARQAIIVLAAAAVVAVEVCERASIERAALVDAHVAQCKFVLRSQLWFPAKQVLRLIRCRKTTEVEELTKRSAILCEAYVHRRALIAEWEALCEAESPLRRREAERRARLEKRLLASKPQKAPLRLADALLL